MGRRRRLVCAVVIAFVCLGGSASGAQDSGSVGAAEDYGCAGVAVQPTSDNQAAIAKTVLCLTNGAREANGLRPLRANHLLRRSAKNRAVDMVERRYFDHRGMVSRIRKTGYTRGATWRIGENLAWGAGESATALEIHLAWMSSPGHRRNILDPRWREIGIGTAIGVPEGDYPDGFTYAVNFGARS